MTGTATFGEPAGQLLFAQLTFCWTLFRVFETHADAVKPSLPDPDLAMAAPSPIRALPHIPAGARPHWLTGRSLDIRAVGGHASAEDLSIAIYLDMTGGMTHDDMARYVPL